MAISLVPWNHVPALMNNSCSKQRSAPPSDITRNLRLLVDGEIITSMQYMGEQLGVRVKTRPRELRNRESLIWGPVATAIVWGLAFSSLLTLFAIPLIFRLFVNKPLKNTSLY